VQETGLQAQASRADALSRLGRHAEALAAWDRVMAATPETKRTSYELSRAEALMRAGQRGPALAPLAKLRPLAAGDGALLYRLAALYAAALALEAPELSAAERSRRTAEDVAAALALLEQARVAGYFLRPARASKLTMDPAWKMFRDRDDFGKFLRAVQAAIPGAVPTAGPSSPPP
jgi:tetratricopeptide (TPR) repeat protein